MTISKVKTGTPISILTAINDNFNYLIDSPTINNLTVTNSLNVGNGAFISNPNVTVMNNQHAFTTDVVSLFNSTHAFQQDSINLLNGKVNFLGGNFNVNTGILSYTGTGNANFEIDEGHFNFMDSLFEYVDNQGLYVRTTGDYANIYFNTNASSGISYKDKKLALFSETTVCTNDSMNNITTSDDSSNLVTSHWANQKLASYATLNSPALTGTPTAPTATAGSNNQQIANTNYVDTAVSNLVNSAPTTLDTLNELATALGNDPNFATTMTTQLGLKANASDLNSYLPLIKSITLTAASWTNGQYTITDTDIKADSLITLTAPNGTSTDNYNAIASAGLVCVSQAAGSIVLKALDIVPGADVTVNLIIQGVS